MVITSEEVAEKGCCEKFNLWWKNTKLVIWNGEKKEFIGRNAYSWGCIVLFYICYFLFTGGYFAVCFSIFMRTLDDRVPTHQKYYSMLKFNPGMTFLPKVKDKNFYIYFNASDNTSYENLWPQLEQEFENYANTSHLKICDKQSSSTFDEACRFNLSSLGQECSVDQKFGYQNGTPCFFFKINSIYGWTPETLKQSDISCHGDSDESNECQFFKIPDRLKSSVDAEHIPISCEGLDTFDEDNLLEVKFYPPLGFPTHFYPFYNQPGFLPPIVAAKFKVRKGVQVTAHCKIWTRNIKHDFKDRQGSLDLELLIDGNIDFDFDFYVNSSSTDAAVTSKLEDYSTTSTNPSPTTLPVESNPWTTTVTEDVNDTKTTESVRQTSFQI